VIELTKDVRTGEYGILIKGGYDLNMSLYILKVVEGGSADRDGRLQTADEIIQINGMTTSNLKLQDIIDAFKLKNSVSLLIRRSGLPLPSSMIQCGQRI
jgi:C-terminal processing protease CtpA/Prc